MSTEKNKSPLAKHIIFIALALVIGCGIGYATKETSVTSIGDLVTSSALIWAFVVWIALIIGNLLFKSGKSKEKKGGGNEGKTATGEKLGEFADSHWVSEYDLEHVKDYMYTKYSLLSQVKKDGILIRNEMTKDKKDLKINMIKPMHTLIVGASGSGKTETYVFPFINFMTRIGSKPSILVTDPKGELYGKTSLTAEQNGYNVICLDLRHPYQSKRWNPMAKSYDLYHEALDLEKHIKKMVGGAPDPKQYKTLDATYGNEWYAMRGVAYPDEQTLKQDLNAIRSELIMQAQKELTDLAMAFCPIQSKQDTSWEQGAQKLIEGVANAMLEDSADPSLGMTREKFCPYNLQKIVCYKDEGEDSFASLKAYIQGRPRDSKALDLCATALFNATNTTRSYMGIATNALGLFTDIGIDYMTSGTEIDLSRFPYDPTIVYFIIPDEDKTRHGLATIFVSQLYKQLIAEAVKCNPSEPALPKNVYFMLDEFANIPKIPDFASLITVGRSRKIFFALCVQSYSQLDGAYGEQDAKTIRENCTIKVYIGTDDQNTKEQFSKLCGNTSIAIEKESSSTDKNGEKTGKSKNIETKERPLIYPDELGHIKEKGDYNIVKIFNYYPMKNIFVPSWKCSNAGIFKMPQRNDPYKPMAYFNTDEYYYDFKAKNKGKANTDNDDDWLNF